MEEETKTMIYQVEDKPPFKKNIVFAAQQFLAILAATILVPALVNSVTGTEYLNQASALVGAGFGTIVYLLFTKFKSPVFLGSSFAFLPALYGVVVFGYFGIILGALLAGSVYVALALIIGKWGTGWIDKYMPPIIIGPVVALIGFSLASSAVNNITGCVASTDLVTGVVISLDTSGYNLWTILVGLVTFFTTAFVSVRGSKALRLYPFIIGIVVGYVFACIVTGIGYAVGDTSMVIMNFKPFGTIGDFSNWIPDLTFLGMFRDGAAQITSIADILTIAILFMPVAFVVFAEHIADHKNLGEIIGRDLVNKEPGLKRTLLGDGFGSMVGAFFGGCPNTTYGESIGCVALSRNSSTRTILLAAIICIIIAFIYPFVAFLETIPNCVVGGISIALYGYIAVSGLRMFKNVDMVEPRNLYVIAAIFITGIGGLYLNFGSVTVGAIASALIVGIITNMMLHKKNKYWIETLFDHWEHRDG